MKKFAQACFFLLVSAVWLAPLFIFRDYLFPYITSKAYPLRVLVELALPFYAYLLLSDRRMWPNLKNPLHLSVILFWVFSFLAGVFGVNPLKSFWGNFERMGGAYYLLHLTLLYFYTVLLGHMGDRWIQRFLYVFLGSALLATLYGWFVWLGWFTFIPDPTYPRISSTFGNPIFFASFLILPICLTAFLALQEDVRWKRIALWVFAALQLMGVYMSSTRGAAVGLVIGAFVGLCAYIYKGGSKRTRQWGLGSLIGLVIVVGLLLALNDKIPQSSPLWRFTNLRDNNTNARIIQWKTALEGFKDRPVLGVGPENYYVVANAHYNPEIYKYDPSWFDKPHNYQLEVLVTTGTLGFLAYLGIFVFSVYALYRGLKAELYGLTEFAVLLGGLVAYQVQNLFVFDTIPASMTFFAATGFCAYLWYRSTHTSTAQANGKKIYGGSPVAANIALAVSAVVAVYLVYVTNVFGARVNKAIHEGFVTKGAYLTHSLESFERARTSNSDFDPVELGNKYSATALSAAVNGSTDPATHGTIVQLIDGAIAANEEAARRVPNDPAVYHRISNLFFTKAIVEKTDVDPRAEAASRKATELAPRRPEPQLGLVRVLTISNRLSEAESVLRNLLSLTPGHPQALLQLALVLHEEGKDAEAAKAMDEAVALGYRISDPNDVGWLVGYYLRNDDYENAVRYLEYAYSADPANVDVAWELAKAYAKVGKVDQARNFAEQVLQSDPSKQQVVQDFLKTLK